MAFENICKNITLQRFYHKVTMAQMAEALGVAETTVQKWEKGKNLNCKTLDDIAAYFQIEPEDLYKDHGDPVVPKRFFNKDQLDNYLRLLAFVDIPVSLFFENQQVDPSKIERCFYRKLYEEYGSDCFNRNGLNLHECLISLLGAGLDPDADQIHCLLYVHYWRLESMEAWDQLMEKWQAIRKFQIDITFIENEFVIRMLENLLKAEGEDSDTELK